MIREKQVFRVGVEPQAIIRKLIYGWW